MIRITIIIIGLSSSSVHFAWDCAPELSWISMQLPLVERWVHPGYAASSSACRNKRSPCVCVGILWTHGLLPYCHHRLFLLPIPHFFHGFTYFNTNKNCCNLCFAEGGTKKLRSTIRRSTETGIAVEMRNRVTRQGSKDSTDGSTNSNSSDGT